MKFALLAFTFLSLNAFAGNTGKILNCSSEQVGEKGSANIEITKLANGMAKIEVGTTELQVFIVANKSAVNNIQNGVSDTLIGDSAKSEFSQNGKTITNAALIRVTGKQLEKAYMAVNGNVYTLSCVRLQ